MLLKMFGPKAASASSSGSSGAVLPNQALDKDSFLRLLVQQMQSQDPLNPADSTQMVSQLAQFSSLEQMNNLNASFTTLSGNIDQLNFISASSMVGRHVTGLDVDKKPVDGTVTNIRMSGSLVYLTVGEQTMSMAGVATIG
ncbi:MAG: flagellar hook capping protein [Candidatus Hydrogenedentes bacterium]|nr:flagellar hook capping protein [Candidatus Hydrogenedentota bacterium]